MDKLAKPCADMPPFGMANYTHRADAGAALVTAGFHWDHLATCWIRDEQDGDEIRAFVRWSEGFNSYYISSI